jgi:hypothetical protein
MLLESKRIRREGERRGTKYFVGGAGSTSKKATAGRARRASKRRISPALRAALVARMAKARAARAAKLAARK